MEKISHIDQDISIAVEELRTGADKPLAFPICGTTKIIFLGWVKEVRTTKS
jgi:hypothetical protein